MGMVYMDNESLTFTMKLVKTNFKRSSGTTPVLMTIRKDEYSDFGATEVFSLSSVRLQTAGFLTVLF